MILRKKQGETTYKETAFGIIGRSDLIPDFSLGASSIPLDPSFRGLQWKNR
jgi:hypothetical protein